MTQFQQTLDDVILSPKMKQRTGILGHVLRIWSASPEQITILKLERRYLKVINTLSKSGPASNAFGDGMMDGAKLLIQLKEMKLNRPEIIRMIEGLTITLIHCQQIVNAYVKAVSS